MRYLALLTLASASTLISQEARSTTRQFDANGNPVSQAGVVVNESRRGGNYARTEMLPTLNGGIAPRISIEERVIRQDGSIKVVERVVRKFDQDGNPVPPEKTLIEQRKLDDGTTSTSRSVYKADLNGNLNLSERATTRSITAGNASSSTTQVERIMSDGTLRLAEKSTTTSESTPGASKESTVAFGLDSNGTFYEIGREVRDSATKNGQTTENRVQYVEGQLVQQEVSTSVTKPDGSTVTQVNIYGQQVRGLSGPTDGSLVLREQQTLESRKVGQAVVETVTSRIASVNEAGRLSEPRKITETVCTGCEIKDPAAKNQPKSPAQTAGAAVQARGPQVAPKPTATVTVVQ